MAIINPRNYPTDHQYFKDAKAFIRALRKRQANIALSTKLIQPVLDQYEVTNEWDIPKEHWNSLEWLTSTIRKERQDLNGKNIRLNRRIEKLKYHYWAIYPFGEEEYKQIFPSQRENLEQRESNFKLKSA